VSLPEAKRAARKLLEELADTTFQKAEEAGYTTDLAKTPEQNAVLLLKTGLPLAIMEPRFAALVG
jgi:hypothetical protein